MATKISHDRWILALDPGTHLLGYCLGRRGDHIDQLRAEQLGTMIVPAGSLASRFGYIREKIFPLMEWADKRNAEVVTEQPFPGGSIEIARVSGLILGEAGVRKLRHVEYLPNVWKRVTGNGAASKDLVAHWVRNLLNLPSLPAPDAADAAGMFIYHATRGS